MKQAVCLSYRRLSATLNALGLAYEIIMVDDGSSDGSLEIISRLNAAEPRVKALSFSRNFGHMIALSAGLDFAQGAAVITLDADLQHPPELIPNLVAKWRAGGQVVNTIRKETGVPAFLKSSRRFFLPADQSDSPSSTCRPMPPTTDCSTDGRSIRSNKYTNARASCAG